MAFGNFFQDIASLGAKTLTVESLPEISDAIVVGRAERSHFQCRQHKPCAVEIKRNVVVYGRRRAGSGRSGCRCRMICLRFRCRWLWRRRVDSGGSAWLRLAVAAFAAEHVEILPCGSQEISVSSQHLLPERLESVYQTAAE